MGLGLWGSAAIWFASPFDPSVRVALSTGFALLSLFCLIGFVFRRSILVAVPFVFAVGAFFAWWATIEPRNDRVWQEEVAFLPQAEIDGSIITLRNIRNFSYRTEQDFVPQWEERTVDLENLDSLDLIAVYWMGDAIAHIILSFGFGEQHIAISIEIRKEEGEAYSTLAGLFRQYELYYVVGDERDLIGVRTTYREPPEDVYLYRIDIPKENIRRLFLEYLRKINGLHDAPEFYNTMTTNCTTNIATHVWALGGKLPLKWEILVSGYFPNLIYDRGGLDQTRPFAELRELSLINTKARSADGDEAFSTLIREGLPGMPDQ